MKLKLLRGSHTKVSQYLGSEGEIIFNTDSNEIHIMDGVSQGGHSFSLNTAGIIAACAMPTPPSGWFACDGSAVSRTVYANLFSAIGELWGAGDGSTTFNLPDLRGEFLRGWSNSSGNDPDAASRTGGDAVGSVQSNGIPRLFGSFSDYHGNARHTVLNQTGHSGTMALYGSGSSSWRQAIQSDGGSHAYVNLDSSLVIPHGSDVRPRNKYVQYCIRY